MCFFLSYSDCYGKLSLPRYCYYSDLNDLLSKIINLEKNDDQRLKLIAEQKTLIDNVNSQCKSSI